MTEESMSVPGKEPDRTSKTTRAAASDDLDFSTLGQIIWRQRALIAGVTSLTACAALGISFVLPKSYTANATLLPNTGTNSTGSMAAVLASQLGPAAGMLGMLGGNATTDLVEVLSSRTMAIRVANQLRVELEHEFKENLTRAQQVKKLQKMVEVTAPTIKNRVVDISVSASRPDLAANIANAYVDTLKGMLDEIGYSKAAKNLRFVREQLRKAKENLSLSEDKLTQFQSANKLASLPEAIIASMKAIGELEAQQVNTEVQLRSTEESLGEIKSRIETLQVDPKLLLEFQIKKKALTVQGSALGKAKMGFLEKLSSLPPKGMELARLQRDVEVQNAIYLALRQQYETALISENKDSDAFILLDRAEAPEKPSKPQKLVIVLLGMMGGLMTSLMIALLRERFPVNPTNVQSQ